jgi:hypothetical protein
LLEHSGVECSIAQDAPAYETTLTLVR